MKQVRSGNNRSQTKHGSTGSAPSNPVVTICLILSILLIVVSFVVFGSRRSSPFSNSAPVIPDYEIIAVVDTSKSTEHIRGSLIVSVKDTASFLGETDILTLIEFASKSTEVYSGKIQSMKRLRSLLVDNLTASDPTPGSDYVAALKSAADAADRSQAKSLVVLISGDGERDGLLEHDPITKRLYREQAQRLAANSKVKEIRFSGVSTDLKLQVREDIRMAFAGPYESKLRILGAGEFPW